MIGVLSKTDADKDVNNVAHQLCNAFDASRKNELSQITNNLVIENDKQHEIQKPLWIFTVYWLIYRNLLIVARDPTIQKLRIVQKIVKHSLEFDKLTYDFMRIPFWQAIAIMAGLCFYGTVILNQYGIQSVQGVLFILISENTFSPMYSALTLFPKREPLFKRERQAGLYNTFQYYLTNVLALVSFKIIRAFQIRKNIIFWHLFFRFPA